MVNNPSLASYFDLSHRRRRTGSVSVQYNIWTVFFFWFFRRFRPAVIPRQSPCITTTGTPSVWLYRSARGVYVYIEQVRAPLKYTFTLNGVWGRPMSVFSERHGRWSSWSPDISIRVACAGRCDGWRAFYGRAGRPTTSALIGLPRKRSPRARNFKYSATHT